MSPNKNGQGTQVIHRMRLRVHREGIPGDEARGDDQRVRARQRGGQSVHGVLGDVLRGTRKAWVLLKRGIS